jgi:hypothetical protein
MDISLPPEVRAEIKAAVKEAMAEVGNTDTLAYTIRTLSRAIDSGPTAVREDIKSGKLRARKWRDKWIVTAPDARAYVASLPEVNYRNNRSA